MPEQIVLPRKFRPFVLHELHDKMSHLGTERVFDLTRRRFYWPRMDTEIDHYVTKQCKCLKNRRPQQPVRAPKEDKNSIPQCIGQSHITTAFSNMAPFRNPTRVRQTCARCAVKTIKL